MINTTLATTLSTDALLALESTLCDQLGRFLGFESHSIYFPASPANEPVYLPEEHRLLLPLIWKGNFLGMLMLTGVKADELDHVISFLPPLMDMALDNLALARALDEDRGSGLATEENFYHHLEHEAAILHARFDDPGQALRATPLYKLCMGMIVLSWPEASALANILDLDFCRDSFQKMARLIKSLLPPAVKAAPLGSYEGRYEFGLILQASGRSACQKLAEKLQNKLEECTFVDSLSGTRIVPRISAGYALYPQDMAGTEMRLSHLAQAFLLRNRARLAASFANDSGSGIMSFNEILTHGGRVLENLGNGKLRVNLGANANAREGLLFKVMSGTEVRGQLVLLDTREDFSIAEVVFVERAGKMPEAGNTLTLLDDAASPREFLSYENIGDTPAKFALSEVNGKLKLWSHGEFLATFAETSSRFSTFSLGIARLVPLNPKDDKDLDMARFLARLEMMLDEEEQNEQIPEPALAGRYGANSLIFLHGDTEANQTRTFYVKVHEAARELGMKLTCGIFSYPFLKYSRGDSERCALKALEYAQLLPEPSIGVLDSLALNISADKQYSLGDTFGAIEEYKLALMADPANAMARNSLGVCMADIGKREDAARLFNDALRDAEDEGLKAKIYYNIGVIFQKRDEPDSAIRYYTRCVRLASDHVYAWLRLGQINEKKGLKKAARKFYERASALGHDMEEIKNIAERRLAKLEAEGGEKEKAREMLHEALVRDPEDAATMLLLAKSYMENHEDLSMAEMFARKSAALSGSDEAWITLAAILVEQGKLEEARKARARSDQ